MRTWFVGILVVFIGIFSHGAWAQLNPDLFKIEMPLANQSDAERTKAIRSGFSQVIAKVATDPTALQNTDVIAAAEQAQNYLTQFNYTPDGTLALQFSQAAVIKLLQKAHLLETGNASSQDIVIHVVNVQDFASFKQIQNYLRSFSGVKKIQLLAVDKNDMQIGLRLTSDQAQFETNLAAANRLQAVSGAQVLPLSYSWHP